MKKNKDFKISFIGSGRVATALAEYFHLLGATVLEIYSPNTKNAHLLAKKVKAKAIEKISRLNPKINLLVIAVKDDAIKSIATKIKLKNVLVIHTSGTVDISILEKCSKFTGILYPLQTFTTSTKIKFGQIPFVIEGNDDITEVTMMKGLAELITTTNKIIFANSEKRKKIHLAAVFVSNFPNYFYAVAEKMLQKEQIPFEILHPLIHRIVENLEISSASKNQTGPAIRKDKKTIDQHLKLLEKDKNLQNIYRLISKSIMKFPFEKKKK